MTLMQNQYKISVTETKLIPRQSPQIPPKLETKLNQLILGDLSNSEKKTVMLTKRSLSLTKYSWVPKKDVDDRYIFLIGIVGRISLKKQRNIKSKYWERPQ